MSSPSPLCPSSTELQLDQITYCDELITITAIGRRPVVPCPLCGTPAMRVQSTYVRTLADLPWQGVRVRLRVTVRRFFCDVAGCPRRIFAERLPATAARYARRTARAACLLEVLGFALGGRAGARLAATLGVASAPGTVLGAVRAASVPDAPTPRVLGVDDWALRRGHRYGTVLVDLERRCVVDLLPGRDAAALTAWLQAHPGVEIISRDRGGPYADGARAGAPDAVQVADRSHLVHNLVQALERACTRHHPALRAAALTVGQERQVALERAAPAVEAPIVAEASLKGAAAERDRLERRARRLARYEQVVALHQAGYPVKRIARTLTLDRRTVRGWLAAGRFPERATRTMRQPRLLDPFRTELAAYYDAGADSATDLLAQLVALGYRGERVTVWRALRALRAERPRAGGTPVPPLSAPAVRVPSSQTTAWLPRKPEAKQTTEERAFLAALIARSPALAEAKRLGDEFVRMLHERAGAAFDPWLDAAARSELRSFAVGIRRDEAAVRAAVTSPWSNGQVEGQVHRIKLVKRSMYGRAGFPLLRARILRAA
jgi:transposase